jgi:prepilin-type N-terminal cleavage/methylation domain-containing protein
MKGKFRNEDGFTLIEMMVVIAITAILAALLFPALSRAKVNGKQTTCLNNLKEIAQGVHMYAEDFDQILFPITNPSGPSFSPLAFYQWTAYDALMRSYVGLQGAPSPQDKVFACPADTFYYGTTNAAYPNYVFIPQSEHLRSNTSYSSYAFNAANAVFRNSTTRFPGMFPGIMGSKLSSIEIPAKTVLVAEFSALDGYSWHQPSPSGAYNNALNMLSFVDGHVSYVKMYDGSNNPSQTRQHPFAFNPPPGYDYKWSGD